MLKPRGKAFSNETGDAGGLAGDGARFPQFGLPNLASVASVFNLKTA